MKIANQRNALIRLTGKTWGVDLERARKVYVAAVRPAITYGAAAWHVPSASQGNPKGVARTIQPLQNDCLRTVAGAYKATRVRRLETEVWCPPIQLHLDRLVASFYQRLEITGMRRLIEQQCREVRLILRSRPKRGRTTRTREGRQAWAKSWLQQRGETTDRRTRQPLPWTSIDARTAMVTSWEQRWHATRDLEPHRTVPADHVDWGVGGVGRHIGLPRALSSLLVQARTEAIGLRDFLARRGVPDVSLLCACGERETVEHVFLHCPNLARPAAFPRSRRELREALDAPSRARVCCRWLLGTGKLREYRLALELGSTDHPLPGSTLAGAASTGNGNNGSGNGTGNGSGNSCTGRHGRRAGRGCLRA